jgi:HicB family
METSHFVDGLRADLAAAAALGDQAIVEAADRLARAVDSSVRVHLLDALQEAAMELTAQLPSGRIDVRLAGGDIQLLYTGEEPAAARPADDDASARITLRLSERLKSQAEAAAGREGVSLNAWLVRTISAGLGRRTVGNRLRGYSG